MMTERDLLEDLLNFLDTIVHGPSVEAKIKEIRTKLAKIIAKEQLQHEMEEKCNSAKSFEEERQIIEEYLAKGVYSDD